MMHMTPAGKGGPVHALLPHRLVSDHACYYPCLHMTPAGKSGPVHALLPHRLVSDHACYYPCHGKSVFVNTVIAMRIIYHFIYDACPATLNSCLISWSLVLQMLCFAITCHFLCTNPFHVDQFGLLVSRNDHAMIHCGLLFCAMESLCRFLAK